MSLVRPDRSPLSPGVLASLHLASEDDALLVSKAFREVLEPIQVRIDRVRAFLTRIKPTLELDILPISDVYGPTGWDPDIQALVVSAETLPGAASST